MAITKKLRFEVFKRDGFCCQYCGKHPPDAVLECDHVIPESKNGRTILENLITACFECNRGKSNRPLDSVPRSLAESAEAIKERRLQLRLYERLLNNEAKEFDNRANAVASAYHKAFPDWSLSETFVDGTLKTSFLKKLPLPSVLQAMQLACIRVPYPDRSIKYFCGICWKLIREERTTL